MVFAMRAAQRGRSVCAGSKSSRHLNLQQTLSLLLVPERTPTTCTTGVKLAALSLQPVAAATTVHTQAGRLRFCTDGLQLDSSRLNLERKLLDGAAKRVRCSLLEWLLGGGGGV